MEEEDIEQKDNLPPIATPNLSSDFQEHIRFIHELKENKSCRGKLYYAGFLLWDGIGNLTPMLIVITSVSSCVAAYTRSMLMENDLAVAASYGGFFGLFIGILLCFVDTLTFWFGAFTDSRSRQRIRNHWHKGYVFTFFVIVMVLFLSIYAIIRLFTKGENDYSLMHLFIG